MTVPLKKPLIQKLLKNTIFFQLFQYQNSPSSTIIFNVTLQVLVPDDRKFILVWMSNMFILNEKLDHKLYEGNSRISIAIQTLTR